MKGFVVTPLLGCPEVIAEGEWNFDGGGGRRRGIPVVALRLFAMTGVVVYATNITLLSLSSGRETD